MDNNIISALRENYSKAELLEYLVDENPIQQFRKWFTEAINSNLAEPNAMTLSTTDGLQPDSRVVLLKQIDDDGFVFFTNYYSHKGQQIEKNNLVAINFLWLELERQVRISGIAEKISEKQSADYFYSRPVGSQLGAIVSNQSSEIDSRATLEEKMKDAIEYYKTNPIVKPENWGGYLVKPSQIEFWQGRSSRLHDRICYKKEADVWTIKRLEP